MLLLRCTWGWISAVGMKPHLSPAPPQGYTALPSPVLARWSPLDAGHLPMAFARVQSNRRPLVQRPGGHLCRELKGLRTHPNP